MRNDHKSWAARYLWWLTPSRVAFAGVAVMLVLLVLPISILGPGDHERYRCGNAFSLDLERWRDVPDGEYFERAFLVCTGKRVDRIVSAVTVGAVTFLIVTIMMSRQARSHGSRAHE
jgi:hypothetical protein